jgi:hypothetical protein
MIPSLMEKIQGKSFDLVICDSILGASYFIKEIMKIPVISSNSSFAMNQLPVPEYILSNGYSTQLDEFYKVLYHVCKIGIPLYQAYRSFFSIRGILISYILPKNSTPVVIYLMTAITLSDHRLINGRILQISLLIK